MKQDQQVLRAILKQILLTEAIEDFQSKKFKDLENGAKKEEFNEKKASEGISSFEDLKNIVDETDPTRGGTYKRWLYDKWFSGGFKTEDKDKVKDYLISFHANRTKLPKDFQDIGRIKTSGELFAVLKDNGFIGLETSKIDPAAISKLEASGDIEPLGENEEWIGWIIKTLKGSCALGKDTEWCTAKYGEQDERNMFSRYHRQGPLYVFIRKTSGTPSKIQLHFFTEQFMDENDHPIEIPPKVLDILAKNMTKLSTDVGYLEFLAKDQSTPPSILKTLVKYPIPDIHERIAANSNATSDILEMLVVRAKPNKFGEDIRLTIAKHKNVTPNLLRKIADDLNKPNLSTRYDVLIPLAYSQKTPPDVLEKFSYDENHYLRLVVAKNPNTTVEVLNGLAEDQNEKVRQAVAENPNTSVETLKSFVNDKAIFRQAIALNPNLPEDVLDILSNDTEDNVRLNVAKNPNTSLETLKSLYELDSSASVGGAAAVNYLKKSKQKLKESLIIQKVLNKLLKFI